MRKGSVAVTSSNSNSAIANCVSHLWETGATILTAKLRSITAIFPTRPIRGNPCLAVESVVTVRGGRDPAVFGDASDEATSHP